MYPKFGNGYVFLHYLTCSMEKMLFACTIMVLHQNCMEIFVYMKNCQKLPKNRKVQISCFNTCISPLDHSNGCFCWIIIYFKILRRISVQDPKKSHFCQFFLGKPTSLSKCFINVLLICPVMVLLSTKFWPDKSDISII